MIPGCSVQLSTTACTTCNSRGDTRKKYPLLLSMSKLGVDHTAPHHTAKIRFSESLLCGARLCCAPQRWPVRETRGDEMDEEIGTLCSPCSGNRGWTGGGEAGLSVSLATELTLHSYIPLMS